MTPEEIRSFPLFARLGATEAAAVVGRVATHRAQRGDFLFRQGEPAHHLVLLRSGQAKMESAAADGTVAIVEILGPGNVLAAANFLVQEPYPVTAVALDAVGYGTLAYSDFEAMVRAHPDIALGLLGYLARRLHRAYAVRRPSARSRVRLADALARIAADTATPAGQVPVVALSHEDLAGVAGMARETVTRHLQRWQAQGVVELGTRSIRVVDLERLRRIADEA